LLFRDELYCWRHYLFLNSFSTTRCCHCDSFWPISRKFGSERRTMTPLIYDLPSSPFTLQSRWSDLPHCYTNVSFFFCFCFSLRILFHSTHQSFRQPCVMLCSIKYSLCCECSVCNQMLDSQLQRSFRSSFTGSYRCLASRADEFCIHFSDFIPIRVFIRLTFLNYLGCSFFVIV